MRDVMNCRTSVLGGHMLKCGTCDFEKNAYNSCRNRHCPKCQFITRERWIEAREEDLLPCSYFHVVFTIPEELRGVFLQNKSACYNLLFKAASETVKEVATNSKHLGAESGSIGVLHTWAQNLVYHPHVHFIVPGGGLSSDEKWLSCKRDFFAPIKILSTIFRAKLLSMLGDAYRKRELSFFGQANPLSSPQIFNHLLLDLSGKDWVVYAKQPFNGPEQVIQYLGRYTHRIAISNQRLVKIEGEKIFFKVRDPDDPAKSKVTNLHVVEFMRRFLLHVLPKRFVKIRHYGFLGSRAKKEKLSLIRRLLGIVKMISKNKDAENWKALLFRKLGINIDECPRCKKGILKEVALRPRLLNSS